LICTLASCFQKRSLPSDGSRPSQPRMRTWRAEHEARHARRQRGERGHELPVVHVRHDHRQVAGRHDLLQSVAELLSVARAAEVEDRVGEDEQPGAHVVEELVVEDGAVADDRQAVVVAVPIVLADRGTRAEHVGAVAATERGSESLELGAVLVLLGAPRRVELVEELDEPEGLVLGGGRVDDQRGPGSDRSKAARRHAPAGRAGPAAAGAVREVALGRGALRLRQVALDGTAGDRGAAHPAAPVPRAGAPGDDGLGDDLDPPRHARRRQAGHLGRLRRPRGQHRRPCHPGVLGRDPLHPCSS
jgi:hypothetical protein